MIVRIHLKARTNFSVARKRRGDTLSRHGPEFGCLTWRVRCVQVADAVAQLREPFGLVGTGLVMLVFKGKIMQHVRHALRVACRCLCCAS